MTTTALPRKSLFSRVIAALAQHIIALLPARVRNAIKAHKKNPTWSRVDEPDQIMPSFMIWIAAIFLISLSMLLVYSIMNESLAVLIGTFIAAQNSTLSFQDRYAAFTAVIILFIDLTVTLLFANFMPSSNDDIVEMISDLDENISMHIAELDGEISQRLDSIERQI